MVHFPLCVRVIVLHLQALPQGSQRSAMDCLPAGPSLDHETVGSVLFMFVSLVARSEPLKGSSSPPACPRSTERTHHRFICLWICSHILLFAVTSHSSIDFQPLDSWLRVPIPLEVFAEMWTQVSGSDLGHCLGSSKPKQVP